MKTCQLRGMNTLSGETTLSNCAFSLLKTVYSKRKEFTHKGSEFFPFKIDSFSEGVCVQERKHEAAKSCLPLAKLAEIQPNVSSRLKTTNGHTFIYLFIYLFGPFYEKRVLFMRKEMVQVSLTHQRSLIWTFYVRLQNHWIIWNISVDSEGSDQTDGFYLGL